MKYQGSAETTFEHQPKHCQASPDTEAPTISRRSTQDVWGGRGSNPRPTDSLRAVLSSLGSCPLLPAAERYWVANGPEQLDSQQVALRHFPRSPLISLCRRDV